MTASSLDDRSLTPEALEAQAWVWLRLLTSGQASSRDAERFRRWVRSSPAHQAAYNEAKLRWDAVRSESATLLRVAPEVAEHHAKTQRMRHRPDRRAFLGVAAGAAAAAAGVAIAYPPLGLWPAPAEWSADYRTATGEQRSFTVADSVDVTLNTQTSVRRQMVGNRTVGLDLVAGEAAIDLQRSAQPFAVAAGKGRSVAESGQFEVRYLDGRACVSCISGAVRVEHPAGNRMLQASQQTLYDARAISSVAAVDPIAASAWRSGILLFDQTRLADAVAEINRYRPGRVVLLNRSMGDRAVSGRFPIKRLDLALWQLQRALGLQAKSLVGGVLILT